MDWSSNRVDRRGMSPGSRSRRIASVSAAARAIAAFRAMSFAAMAFALALGAHAATNVSGVVTDSITGKPVAGAQVTLGSGPGTLGVGTTEPDGVFRLFVDVPVSATPRTLNLLVSHPGYVNTARNVVVTAGQADQLSYRLALTRSEARNCKPDWERTVVVGHVRPPTSAAGDLALSERVSEVLQYDLLSEVQKTHLPPSRQPMVLACPDARPRSLGEHSDWARALKADAFVVGMAESVNRRFRVELQVTDRQAGAGLPTLASTPAMNLDLPPSADLGRAALEPIMIALLKAYQKDGRYAECVEFSVAAEHALGRLPVVSEVRAACQSRLPNLGLLRGGAP